MTNNKNYQNGVLAKVDYDLYQMSLSDAMWWETHWVTHPWHEDHLIASSERTHTHVDLDFFSVERF